MVVKRKPQVKTVEEFIGAGGTVAQEQDSAPQPSSSPTEPAPLSSEGDEEIKSLKMRLPVSLLKQIDDAVAQRRPAPSRHQWILEAIWEKLERGTEED